MSSKQKVKRGVLPMINKLTHELAKEPFTRKSLSTGSKLSLPVIREISALVSTSIPVSKVVIHLYQRRVVSNDDYEDLKKEQPSAGIKLSHALVASSKRSVGEGKNLIKNLYLALLDAFLDTYDQGCHHVALHLRETGMQLPS